MRLGSSFVSLVGKPEGEWTDRVGRGEGRAAGFLVGSRCSIGGGRGGEGRKSYLWGSEEGRRGFREDSYKAIGTHKIRHFQLHRVGQS